MFAIKHNRAVVTAPYNEQFVKFANSRKAEWSKTTKSWSFDLRDTDAIKNTLKSLYGVGDDATDLVDLHITVVNDFTLYKVGFVIAGHYLAHDEEWKKSPNAYLTNGRVVAGGSRKNWTLIFEKGTTFELRDIQRSTAELALSQTNADIDADNAIQLDLVPHAEVTDPYEHMTRQQLQAELQKAQALVWEIQKAIDARPKPKKKKSIWDA